MTPAQYNGILAQFTALIAAVGSASVATPGTIILYGSATTPTGFLPCDGAAVSRTTYGALFAVIGTSFGIGNGTTTFNVPDLRSRLPMGVGAGPGLTTRVLGDQGGVEGTVVNKQNLANFGLTVNDAGHVHTITVNDPSHNHNGFAAANIVTDAAGTEYVSTLGNKGVAQPTTASAATGIAPGADSNVTGVTVDSGGSAIPLPTIDPFTAVGYYVKT